MLHIHSVESENTEKHKEQKETSKKHKEQHEKWNLTTQKNALPKFVNYFLHVGTHKVYIIHIHTYYT